MSEIADPVTAITLIASIITMIVGFVTIWNSIRNAKRQAREDMERSNKEAESRLKEFVNLKLEAFDNKIDDMKANHQHLENFMSTWMQRMEDKK